MSNKIEEVFGLIKVGLGDYSHWVFSSVNAEFIEESHWKNVYLNFELEKGSIPEELTEPSILVVIDEDTVMDMVLQNEGVDCEYKLTDLEKEQLVLLLEKEGMLG
ncbi:hypothetical protein [Alkalihalobacillus sp. AL-G]|uniref:hypothetical protein n=1 Tax=Alkalihalobacillus sp. AL-G TaxID=2926399 RepID=UPI00272D1E7A|nr:hypothetical protein [Alkalihalobacillus sp. AL-G]WLD92669.1 hypothetical protein MOJ78_16885 [Alkalihalobacillus sp. AL-G]